MTTALTKPAMGGSLITRDSMRAMLGTVAKSMPRVATGGIDFLKMDKRGDWTYGQDSEEVEYASIWAVNPATLQHGWIAWGEELGNEPLGEIMVSAFKDLPDVNSLTPPKEGKGWLQQYSVELLCISGPNEGAHVLYKKESTGAIKLFNKYIDELMNRVDADSDELVALVHITSESYDHKKFKETWNPIFEYISWNEPDDVTVPAAANDEKAAAPAKEKAADKPAARTAPKPKAPAAAPAPETDAEEDDYDAQIRKLQAAKLAKQNAAAGASDEQEDEGEEQQEAEQPEEAATPRRRARR